MSINYRCSLRRKCGARKTLKKPIEEYVKTPLCPGCGQDTLKSVDACEKARNKRRMCNCGGFHHHHNTGREPWCVDAPVGPTEEDFQERYSSVQYGEG